MRQHFHQGHHASVLDFNAGDFAAADMDGHSQSLEQREVDMYVEQAGLEVRQAIRDC